MIRPLRRAHGVATLVLLLVAAATLAAALILRVATPVMPRGAIEVQP